MQATDDITLSRKIVYTGLYKYNDLESVHNSRAWYNGSTSASQAEDEGSIPFARTKNSIGLVPIFI